jgi:hypothetical protein
MAICKVIEPAINFDARRQSLLQQSASEQDESHQCTEEPGCVSLSKSAEASNDQKSGQSKRDMKRDCVPQERATRIVDGRC